MSARAERANQILAPLVALGDGTCIAPRDQLLETVYC